MRRSLLSALLLALPLASCSSLDVPITAEPDRPLVDAPRPGGNPEVPLPRPASGVLPPGAADKVLPAGQPPIIKLLEPGAEPRSDLGYTLTKGTTQKVAMAVDTTMGVKSKGQNLPQTPMPRMTMTFTVTTADKNAAGEFKIDSRLVDTAVDPSGGQQEQMAKVLRPQMEATKGLGIVYWASAKGNVRELKLDMPAGVPPAAQALMTGMSQVFESMVTPFPQEPVGVGARWQVVSRFSTGGADILQSAIYTLKSRSGARATVDVALLQLAAGDTVHNAQMPAGMLVKVKSFNATGNGTAQLDLKSVAPEGRSMAIKSGMEISVAGAGAGPAEDSTVETSTTVQTTRP